MRKRNPRQIAPAGIVKEASGTQARNESNGNGQVAVEHDTYS